MTCDNNCLAKNIQTSGQQLTFKLPGSTSATFEQINAIDGVIVFQGGSLIIKDFVMPQGAIVISEFLQTQVTADNMHVTTAAFIASTANLGTVTITNSLQLIETHFTVQTQAYLYDILSIQSSVLIIQSGCSIPDMTPSHVLNSAIFTTPACPFMPSSMTSLQNSKWTIEAPEQTSFTISSPFALINSTLKVTRVNLHIKSELRMRNNSVIDSDFPVELSYYGRIGGQGSITTDLTVKQFGRIESAYMIEEQYLLHQQLNIMGTLSMDRSSTIHLQHAESVKANSILLSDSNLEISFELYAWNATAQQLNYTLISSTQGEISGSFDYINVTMIYGYYQLKNSKSDMTFLWQLNQPVPPSTPHSVNAPVTVQVPIAAPVGNSDPVSEVIPPSSEPDPQGTDFKKVVIVIESIMIGIGLILGGALVYRRFKKRRDYTEVPSFDQL
jgi:hypothetical protein